MNALLDFALTIPPESLLKYGLAGAALVLAGFLFVLWQKEPRA